MLYLALVEKESFEYFERKMYPKNTIEVKKNYQGVECNWAIQYKGVKKITMGQNEEKLKYSDVQNLTPKATYSIGKI